MTTARRRTALRLTAGLAGAAVAVLLGATAASAHVHVDGEDATQGGYGVLTFRVPTESATASTTRLSVTMPKDHPIASASILPVAGWTAKVITADLATPIKTDDGEVKSYVAKVTWTADTASAAIKPGEFQTFSISAGPLPEVAQLSFPALQSYSDGSTVNWNEQASGTAEPEHPAPVLVLAESDEGGHHAATATQAATETEPTVATSSAADGSALAVGIGGVGVALVALVVAVIALLRGSKRARA